MCCVRVLGSDKPFEFVCSGTDCLYKLSLLRCASNRYYKSEQPTGAAVIPAGASVHHP
jgi:hypothetical protein